MTPNRPTTMTMKIAILGATGETGIEAVKYALAEGHSVRTLANTPELLYEGGLPKKSTVLEVIEGDESSLEDVKKLVHGCDAVLSTLGSNDGFWNQTKQTTYYSTTAATIVKACQEESVKRLIGMTSSGVEHDNDAPLLYRATTRRMHMPTFRDMNKMEDIIEDSKLEWTLVRPSKLIHDKSKEFRVRDRANPKKGRKISHRDTAKFMVDEAEENKWINQHPALAY